MDYFKILPVESTLDILTRVPTESVLECKLVCTNWRRLVSHHPSFSKKHLHHLNHPYDSSSADSGKLGFVALTDDGCFQYFEYNDDPAIPLETRVRNVKFTSPFSIDGFIGSINGLLCFDRSSSVSICNPITKEVVVLPELDIHQYKTWMSGFGYVCATNEYKIVRIYMLWNHLEVHICTVGKGNLWRNIGKFDSQFRANDWDIPGVFVNGVLYWIGRESEKIVTFDLAEEKFCEHLSPPPLPPGSYWGAHHRIGVLDGFLYICIHNPVEGRESYDIWLLKKKTINHEMKEQEENKLFVWSKEFSVDENQVLGVTKGDGILTYVHNYLNIYHTKNSTSEKVMDFESWICEVFAHKNSLVSLKELSEEDTKTMESVGIKETQAWVTTFNQLLEDANSEHMNL